MELILALTIGVLFAVAAYLLLRRSIVKMILGIVVMSQAVNLLILTAAGLTQGGVPFVADPSSVADAALTGQERRAPETQGGAGAGPGLGDGSESRLGAAAADPLPQALILTAIVISFGVLAFTLAMSLRADQTVGTDDLDAMKGTDE